MGIEAFGLRPSHPLCYAMLCYARFVVSEIRSLVVKIAFVHNVQKIAEIQSSVQYYLRLISTSGISYLFITHQSTCWLPSNQ